MLNLQENMRVKNEMNKYPRDNQLQENLVDYKQWLLKLGEGRLHAEGKMRLIFLKSAIKRDNSIFLNNHRTDFIMYNVNIRTLLIRNKVENSATIFYKRR